MKEWPPILLRRWLLSAAAGLAFFLAGAAAYAAARDHVLLILSTLLAVFTFLRCLSFYRMAAAHAYDAVDGVCIGVKRTPMRKQQSVRLLTSDGVEHTVTLDKHTRLFIGNRYRVYYRRNMASGQTALPFQGILAQDMFLGLEDLGEYQAEQK